MTATAGYTEVVYARTDTTAADVADKIDGISEFSFSRSRDMEDVSNFADGDGYKRKLATMMDSSISMSGQYESGDTIQALLRTAYGSGATIYVTIHVDPSASSGSKGWRIPCIVESYDANGSVGGAGQFSVSLTGNGAPVAV